MRITVLGAGSWGTSLAILLARNGHEVILFGRNECDLREMRDSRENAQYVPGIELPPNLRPEWDPTNLQESGMWIVAVPAVAVREVMALVQGETPLLVVAAKGLEPESAKLLCQVCEEACPSANAGVLSGPNLALEIVRQIPTAAVAAFKDPEHAEAVRATFMCRSFRVYLSDDVTGVELAGALKNVLAIAAGMSDALGYGDNTKGALLARGLHQMTALGLAMGARVETFMGIAGVGDLFATASSKLSRNYRVGLMIGQGIPLEEALQQIGQVAEGVYTSTSALELGRRYGVDMPVFEFTESVLHGRVDPREAVGHLMARQPKSEGFFS